MGEDAEELSVVPGEQLIVLGEVDGWLQVHPRLVTKFCLSM